MPDIYVSIICPIYNGELFIDKLIPALLNQDFPHQKYEIIIIDNGSNDLTLEKLKNYPVQVFSEPVIKSSYGARNLGINSAKGDILAFIDSDCIAESNWLKEGVESLLKNGADMIAGHVHFIFKNPTSPWEIFDATFHMNQELSSTKGYSATANLFVKKELFHQLGLFNSKSTSGEDKAWTSKAVASGKKLIYEKNATVNHPTRNKDELIKKALRTGGGFLNSNRRDKSQAYQIGTSLLFISKNLFPLPFAVKKIYLSSPYSFVTKLKIHMVLIVIRNIRSLGLIQATFGKRFR